MSSKPKEVPIEEAVSVDTETPHDWAWLETLRRPVDPGLIKVRQMKWGSSSYVEWHKVADILDRIAGPDWSFTIRELKVTGLLATAHATLTIHGVSRDNVGVGTADAPERLETAIKGAASDALKRCAVMFGLARDLYDGDDDHHHARPAQAQTYAPTQYRPAASAAGSGGGVRPASEAQMRLIDRLCGDAGLDPDEESNRLFGVPVTNLNIAQASQFISDLKGGS